MNRPLPELLAEIDALLAEATKGPWEAMNHPRVGIWVRSTTQVIKNDRGPDHARDVLADEDYEGKFEDAHVIAALFNLYPQLREAAQDRERMQKALERLMRQPTENPIRLTPGQRGELFAAHAQARAALARKEG